MANPTNTLRKIIELTNADPPRIVWHRFVVAKTVLVADDLYEAKPVENSQGWFSFVRIAQKNVTSGSVTGKVLVAGQIVQTFTVEENGTLVLTNFASDPLYTVASGKFYYTQGYLEVEWTGVRAEHQIMLDYEYTKTDLDLGDLSYVYYTGDTPWRPAPQWDWGVAASFAPRAANSIIKVKKIVVYENRVPIFVLEPAADSAEEREMNKLFQDIEFRVLDPFYSYMTDTTTPDYPGDEDLVLG